MLMDPGMDTGAKLLTRKIPIRPTDTAQTLHDRLSVLGAELLLETLDALDAGTLVPEPQDHNRATYAPMLTKQDGKIDWRKSAAALEPFIRGMTPWPGAFTLFGDQRLRIFKGRAIVETASVPPGTVVSGFDDELRVATGEGILAIEELQPAGGKRMAIADYLRGCCIPPGTIFL